MKFAYAYDEHHNSGAEWEKRQARMAKGRFDAPDITIQKGCTQDIRDHIEGEFISEGWAMGVNLDQGHGLKIFAMKDDLAFQLQTGNMSRAPYDLLKLQYLFSAGRIEAAAIGLPTQLAARSMGDNIANAERVIRELQLFDRVISVPILVVAFE